MSSADVLGPSLLECLSVLCSHPSPYGEEGRLARHVIEWAEPQWPGIRWEYLSTDDALSKGNSGAVVATAERGMSKGGMVLYAHLDTSLNGDALADRLVVGDPPPQGWPNVALSFDEVSGQLSGAGLAVAKAPAAAAMLAFVRTAERLERGTRPYRLQLLLSSRGTHRFLELSDGSAHRPPTGVARYLEEQARPHSALVAKSGPDAILLEEPGAFFVRVKVTSEWGVVMNRRLMSLDGGLLRHVGELVDAMEDWADQFRARVVEGSSCGHEFGLGVVRSGYSEKPDLVPAMLEVVGYGVMPAAVDSDKIEQELRAHLHRSLGAAFETPGVVLDVLVHTVYNGAATSIDTDVARAAVAAWAALHGSPPAPIQQWKGNTDGVALRAAGIPTVRIGPRLTSPSIGPVDFVDMSILENTARVYEDVALRCAVM